MNNKVRPNNLTQQPALCLQWLKVAHLPASVLNSYELCCERGKQCLFLLFQTLVSVVNSFHEKITALEEKASQLEKVSNDASKATISRSMTTVWQRWTRLRNVAQEQEKILEEAVQEWKGFNDKVTSGLGKSSFVNRA